jgi:hypothetical protein
MSKPKVLVCVLTGPERTDWLNPSLVMNLLTLAKDPRADVYFHMVATRPFDAARNVAVDVARRVDADWLISFDNDNFLLGNPLDVLLNAGPERRVVGLTYGVKTAEGSYGLFPNILPNPNGEQFQEVQAVAGGALMIHKSVWQKIKKGPWFRWMYPENELLAHMPGDDTGHGEDVFFSRLVRRHGFKVWTHISHLAGHMKTTDVTRMANTLAQLAAPPKQGPVAGMLRKLGVR